MKPQAFRFRGSVAVRVLTLGLLVSVLVSVAPVQAEPSLEETLCDMGFAITGECGIGYNEIICTRAQGINCFVVMPPGPYKMTLLAEHTGSHASLELNVFTDYNTPVIGPLLFSGPTGNEGETNPRVSKFIIVNQEFGFTLDAPDDRFYSVNFLNPDPTPFPLPRNHVRTFQNGFDKTKFLIGFEQSFNGGDEDFQDLVFSVEVMAECPDGTNVDSDGDGLLDCWETAGEIDFDKDGSPDVSLKNSARVILSDPDHKDLFLEFDWVPGQEPSQTAIQTLKAAFAAAPIDAGGIANPDGQPGINLWVDTGNLTDGGGALVGDNMGGGNAVGSVGCLDDDFYSEKRDNFAAPRRFVFRYGISGDPVDNDPCLGGRAEVGGNDFVDYNHDAGTIMHEVGHTLTLRHGGNVTDNCKPNYVSVMNYDHQGGISQVGGGRVIDYSPPRFPGGRGVAPLPPLDEAALNESITLDPTDAANMFVFVNGLGDKVPWPLNSDIDGDSLPDGADWNGDGDTNDGVVPPQNVDTSDMTSGNPARCTNGSANSLLTGHDDWSVIALNFRLFGDPDDGSLNPITEPEPTLDEIQELQDVLDRACGGLAPTIVGTPGDDVIRGTAGDDVINGLGGNDAIFGGGGNDVICGGPGSDKLSGGSGDDRIFGGDGNDGLNGGSGDDVLTGGPGRDKLNGRSGIDKCVTGESLRNCEL